MFYALVVALSVCCAALLMVVILMQASKGGGLSGAFGGMGGGDTMLSTRQAASVLHKLTIYLVSGFLFLCLLATMLSRRGGSELVTATEQALQEQTAVSQFDDSIPVIPEIPETGTEEGQ